LIGNLQLTSACRSNERSTVQIITVTAHSGNPVQRTCYLQRVTNPTTGVSRVLRSERGHVRIQNGRKNGFARDRAGNRLDGSGWHYLCRRHGWQGLKCPVLGSLILTKPKSTLSYMSNEWWGWWWRWWCQLPVL